jgi:predicted phage terminase large subunit-like protein
MSDLVTLEDGRKALEITYGFSETATAFILDTTFITGYYGPFGCSKTAALCFKAWNYAQAYPGSNVGLLRNTWPNLRETTMKEFFKWFPPGIAGHYHKTDKIFELWLGGGDTSLIHFRHMDTDQDIDNTLSLNLDAMGFDEPQGGLNSQGGLDPGISVNLYRTLTGRLGRDINRPPGLAWLTGNPPAPDHWIAMEFCYDGKGEPTNPDPDKRLYLGRRSDNQHNLKSDYYDRLERLWGRNTPMTRRYLYGEWISFGVEKPFHRAWIRRWGADGEWGLPPETYLDEYGRARRSLVVEAAFDPAISKRDVAARSALVVGAQSRHPANRGRIFLLESLAGHWSVWEQVDHILKAVMRWKIRVVRIEKVAYQAALKDLLDREARNRGILVTVDLVPPEGDKIRRANAWSGLVEDGTVLFAPDEATDDLIECMIAVPGDPTKWDPVDAAGMLIQGFPVLTASSSRLEEPPGAVLAESYAGAPPSARHTSPFVGARRLSALDRAKGYAGRPPGSRESRGSRPR